MSQETDENRGQILVADDDPSILRLIKTILEKQGFTVVTANDGREAYRLLVSGELFVAAFFDVVMPHITGTDLVKEMQTDGRLMKIPVVIMTAEHNPQLAATSLTSGAVSFLPKPFTMSQVKNVALTFYKETF